MTLTKAPLNAQDIISQLNLIAHPEGGHYREVYRAAAEGNSRSAITSIYYLLQAHERSAWHRVDATEIWHLYAGAPLELVLRTAESEMETHKLGIDLAAGEHPQVTIPPFAWQRARTLGDWTLVGCTVAPGFEFAGFELAPDGVLPEG
jgi:predicted cupin superfamily sugar epimerase